MYDIAACIATAVVLAVISIIAVILRFYVRLRTTRTFLGIDDWLIVSSVVLVCGQMANQIVATVEGLIGRDGTYDKPDPARLKIQTRTDTSLLIVEKITYATIKLSVLFFYRRIFKRQKSFRIANDILIVVVTVWGLVYFVGEFLLCGANVKPGGHPCTPREWFLLWFGITDVLTDIAILSLPYPCIRKLHLDRREKIGLAGVFMLGTISMIFGIVRLGFVSVTFERYFHPEKFNGPPARTPPSFWTNIECAVGVVAACLPPLGPIIKKVPGPKSIYASIRKASASYGSRGPRSHGPHQTHRSDKTLTKNGDEEATIGITKKVSIEWPEQPGYPLTDLSSHPPGPPLSQKSSPLPPKKPGKDMLWSSRQDPSVTMPQNARRMNQAWL